MGVIWLCGSEGLGGGDGTITIGNAVEGEPTSGGGGDGDGGGGEGGGGGGGDGDGGGGDGGGLSVVASTCATQQWNPQPREPLPHADGAPGQPCRQQAPPAPQKPGHAPCWESQPHQHSAPTLLTCVDSGGDGNGGGGDGGGGDVVTGAEDEMAVQQWNPQPSDPLPHSAGELAQPSRQQAPPAPQKPGHAPSCELHPYQQSAPRLST